MIRHMNIRSAKAKGRRLAQQVKDSFLKFYSNISENDINVTPASVPGADIHLSDNALSELPVIIECKNQEKLQIWDAYAQAETHSLKSKRSLFPLLCFKRNRSDVMICMKLDHLLGLLQYAKAKGIMLQKMQKDNADQRTMPPL